MPLTRISSRASSTARPRTRPTTPAFAAEYGLLVPPISHAHDRGKRDNAPLAVLAHRRRGGTHNAKDAVEVNVECGRPFLVAEVGERGLMGDASIGEDDVERTVFLFNVGNNGIRLLRAPN